MYYLLFSVIPLLVLSFAAQQYVEYVFFKWGKVGHSASLTGMQVAERISRDANLNVKLTTTDKKLGDHYDPTSHTVCLSKLVAQGATVASIAVAAHELGHAQQQLENTGMIRLRAWLVPAVRIAPSLSYLFFFLAAVMARFSLVWLGIACLALTTVFMLMTLPIEFDASRRAFVLLERSGLITAEDRRGARHVLRAAGLTYVVASTLSVVQLARYVLGRR